jgi:hypothetical protein
VNPIALIPSENSESGHTVLQVCLRECLAALGQFFESTSITLSRERNRNQYEPSRFEPRERAETYSIRRKARLLPLRTQQPQHSEALPQTSEGL